jgi:hypothetical protein
VIAQGYANDKALAWLLIVIEESPEIPSKYGFLQFGLVNHDNNTLVFDLPEGYKTSASMTGQFIVMCADDVNEQPTLTAIEPSDIGILCYPDATDNSSAFYLQTYSHSRGIYTRTDNK